MPANIKISDSVWGSISKIFIKTSDTVWSSVKTGLIKISDTVWATFFTGSAIPSIASRATISQSTSSVNGLITLTGTNYHWTNYASAAYFFESSTDNSNWTTIDSGTITNPSTGSSNTKTYQIQQSDVVANATNYFRFTVTVTSSTSTIGSSISVPTSFEMPRDITNLSVTSQSQSSISLAWTASQYSGSQVVQYKTSASSTWSTSSTQGSSVGDLIVFGLSASTTYNFRILPWTGSDANFGYYGNYSNTATGTTTALKPPNPVTNLSVSNIQTTSVTLSWNAPSTDSSHDAPNTYDIAFNTNGANPGNNYYTSIFTWQGTSYAFSPGTLSAGTFYYFWVRAYNNDGPSPWQYVTAQTAAAVIIPGQVTGLSHTKAYSLYGMSNTLTRISASTKVQDWSYDVWVDYQLSWSAATNAVSYEITSNSVNSNPGVGYYTSSGTSYTDRQFQSNRNTVTSYYWVRAVSSTGHYGSWSAVTGGTSTATATSAWTLTLWRCNNSASTPGSAGSTALTYTWSGVNTSFTHYSTISGSIAGTPVSRTSVGCV